MSIDLYQGDCLEIMKDIPSESIDMILCDLPYGTTSCKWDVVIPFELLWEQYNRIIKDNGAIVLFGSEPFSSALRVSNLKNFRYDWVWKKDGVTNFANAKKMPLHCIENISVFIRNYRLTIRKTLFRAIKLSKTVNQLVVTRCEPMFYNRQVKVN